MEKIYEIKLLETETLQEKQPTPWDTEGITSQFP